MMKKSFIALLAALMLAPALRADRGMWLPALIGTRIKDMRSKGFRLSAEDIYSVNKASLKDAVVLFNGGCTGELVSGEGLLLTNHHCGYGAIQSHSSVRHDYLTDGFWAMNRSEELPNPGLYVSFLVRMEDVTAQVLDGVRDDLPEARRDSLIRFNAARVADAAVRGTDCRADVEPFFYGNQYFLFVYRNYTTGCGRAIRATFRCSASMRGPTMLRPTTRKITCLSVRVARSRFRCADCARATLRSYTGFRGRPSNTFCPMRSTIC